MRAKTKTFLLGTVSAIALGGSALAADLPVKARLAPPIYPAPATWTGCYIGGAVGAANHRTTGNFEDGVGAVDQGFNFDKTGGIYGGYVGCNWQNRAFVYGIEGDFSGLSGTSGSQVGPQDTDYGFGSKITWLSTIRGRAGLGVDKALLYITGGVAFADVQTTLSTTYSTTNSVTNTRFGWTVGAGVEYQVTPNWIARGELLYVDLGNNSNTIPLGASATLYTSNLSHELMIGRVGLAYKW